MALGIEYKKGKLKGLHYIVVDLKLKKETLHRRDVKGLFIGVRSLYEKDAAVVLTKDPFIWIQKGEYVHMLNLTRYDVTTIEISDGSVSSSTIYTDLNQDLARERLQLLMDCVTSEKRVHANGLIDINTYKRIPEYLVKGVEEDSEIKRGTTTLPSQNKYTSSSSTTTKKTCTGNKKQTQSWIKKVHTSTFKRTTKYGIKNAMENMAAKIDAIKNGTYEAPQLKEIPGDKEKEEPADNTPKSAITENCGHVPAALAALASYSHDDDLLPAGMC